MAHFWYSLLLFAVATVSVKETFVFANPNGDDGEENVQEGDEGSKGAINSLDPKELGLHFAEDEERDNEIQRKLILKSVMAAEEIGEPETIYFYWPDPVKWKGALCKGQNSCDKENTVLYIFHDDFDDTSKTAVTSALEQIAKATCIKFEKYENIPEKQDEVEDYIRFIMDDSNGCTSYLGRVARTTIHKKYKKKNNYMGHPIVISSDKDDGCAFKGGVLHQILHTFGFVHEHQRQDRDKFVTYIPDNLDNRSHKSHFDKIDSKINEGFKYDYGSIMHFPKRQFGKPLATDSKLEDPDDDEQYTEVEYGTVPKGWVKKAKTLRVKGKMNRFKNFFKRLTIGQRKGLSKLDVKKLKKLWQCKA